MKRVFVFLLIIVILLSGCGVNNYADSSVIHIVCTSFPYFDFARNIAGDRAEVTLLVPVGTDIHAFDPTPKDVISASKADIFIANGGESDSWAKELLGTLDTKPKEILYMTELVPLLTTDGEHHIDEHIWTSPKNAEVLTAAICDKLCLVDSDNADYYRENLSQYSNQLSELDKGFREAVKNGTRKTVVFGDRFPFLYLAKEYGFDYLAAFSGCSELTEPTAKTVSKLIERVRLENIPTVFYVEFSNRKICDAICAETGAKPLLMHSVHNLTKEEFDTGADYISIMTENVKALEEAMG